MILFLNLFLTLAHQNDMKKQRKIIIFKKYFFFKNILKNKQPVKGIILFIFISIQLKFY